MAEGGRNIKWRYVGERDLVTVRGRYFGRRERVRFEIHEGDSKVIKVMGYMLVRERQSQK